MVLVYTLEFSYFRARLIRAPWITERKWSPYSHCWPMLLHWCLRLTWDAWDKWKFIKSFVNLTTREHFQVQHGVRIFNLDINADLTFGKYLKSTEVVKCCHPSFLPRSILGRIPVSGSFCSFRSRPSGGGGLVGCSDLFPMQDLCLRGRVHSLTRLILKE